ncbi:hypothetical protein SAMN05444359_105182 [Neolewinella agarilytica]|uniref:Heparinase II/III-like protein n=1 Tax=Neolewinella agarilytica TaxID=478744 RepID=A0A1H9D7R3_9BACT|nr:hypothetical protein SAMN05444359_105182 [Neolewinella agarilytica]
MDVSKLIICFLLAAWFSGCSTYVQVQSESSEEQRPMIWVRPSERPAILAKIADNESVAKYYAAFAARVGDDLRSWEQDPEAYFRQLPFSADPAEKQMIPPFKTYTSFSGADREEQDRMMHQLQTAVDCGVLYFLTEEERYARYAADVLHTFVQALTQMPLNTDHYNAGWIYTQDHLREAREIGAQLPLIYDFIQPWLEANGKVFDLGKGTEVAFDQTRATDVFRTYAELALTRGGTGHNWPILEAASLVGNALALPDPAERAHYLKFFLKEDTKRQDALPTIGAFYDAHGGSWPESFGYSQHVGEFLTYLFAVLSHHDPSSGLVGQYPQVVAALPEAYYFTYPGGKETILHGDGHRAYHPMIKGYEIAYHLGQREGRPELTRTFGPLINHSVQSGDYKRFAPPGQRTYPASPYREPVKLLWFEPEVPTQAGEYPLPVTDELPFAGITIQRNLSPSGKAEDGLMGFIGGGSYVHGHATGLSMELFGKGFVLGGKGGRTQYRTEIHDNYYRIFASNNTVIVNGASQSSGGWVSLGTDRARRLAAEPEPDAPPVSPDFSFTTAAFRDTVGDAAEAYQERTLGIIRTSDSTGYYVDLFRSHSELPEQYHDYIYRNPGESLVLRAGEKNIELSPTPERYQANANDEWKSNRSFRHPGWHYFEDVKTSAQISKDVTVTFRAEKLGPQPIQMRAFLPGQPNRSYTTATSPPLTEGPDQYRKERAPTLVIRQEGSAWDTPFAVVYEPAMAGESSIAAVEAIRRERRCEGILVKSNERTGGITQLVLLPTDPDKTIHYPNYDISFRGRYAVVTLTASGELQSVYLGQGEKIKVGRHTIRSAGEESVSAFINLSSPQQKVSTSEPLYFSYSGEPEKLVKPD